MIVRYIDKKIQETLKARERAFARKGQSSGEAKSDDISFSDIMSRTVYIRMASNKENSEFNVMIDGGTEVSANVRYRINKEGDAEAYTNTPSTRKGYGFKEDGTGSYRGTKSSGIRPISGIKDISVEYKGGYKAIRKGTINWTVGSLEDLDRLTPHFLTIGQSVALEWGWQLADKKDTNVGNFITIKNVNDNNVIDVNSDLFDNPIPTLISKGGDYDAMGGIISNFEYKLREDGGFDCTTYITAMGAVLFKQQTDKEGEFSLGALYDKDALVLTDKDEKFGKFEKHSFDGLLHGVLNLKNIVRTQKLTVDLITPQVSVDKSSDSYYLGMGAAAPVNSEKKFITNMQIKADTEYNLIHAKFKQRNLVPMREDYFVRWGWFEDNILSRYTSVISNDDDEKISLTFRSIEPIPLTTDDAPIKGEAPANTHRSTYISNNKDNLRPIDPFKFLLFGQNPSPKHVEIFTTSTLDETEKLKDKWRKYFDALTNHAKLSGRNFAPSGNPTVGQIRNIFVNVDEIQKAFGVDLGDGVSYTYKDENYYVKQELVTPPSTVEAALSKLMRSLESNFYNYWKLNIVSDGNNPGNLKIVDENYVSPGTTKSEITYTKFEGDNPLQNKAPSPLVSTTGIYKFPSFTIGSIVKSQDLSFKIPDSMAMIAMYGSSQEQGFSSEEYSKFGKLMMVDKSIDDITDAVTGKLKRAYLNNKVGSASGDESIALTTDGGIDISTNIWLRYVKTVVEDSNLSEGAKNKISKADVSWEYNNGKFKKIYNQGKSSVDIIEPYLLDTSKHSIVMKPGAKQSVKDYFNSPNEGSKYLSTYYLIPAELSLEIDGIAGIQPGNICHIDYIQQKYNREIGEYGPPTFFQIFGIDQKVDSSGWTTSLTAKMRMNSGAMNKIEESSIAEYLNTLSDRSFNQSGNTTVEVAERVDYNELDEAVGFSGETEIIVIPSTGEIIKLEPLLGSGGSANINSALNKESTSEVDEAQSKIEKRKVDTPSVVELDIDEIRSAARLIWEAMDGIGTDQDKLFDTIRKYENQAGMLTAIRDEFNTNFGNGETLFQWIDGEWGRLSKNERRELKAYFE